MATKPNNPPIEPPAPPASLPENLHARWRELAGICVQLGTLYSCDLKDLERYVLLAWEYDAITPKIVAGIKGNDAQSVSGWATAQDKISKQMQPLATKFGLNSPLTKARRLASPGGGRG